VSQHQRSAPPIPSVQGTSPSRTITTRVGLPIKDLVKTSGPCGLEIYGDINLLDFAFAEGLLTPGPESEPTALPSPSELTAILNLATSVSPDHQHLENSHSSLAETTHSLTPVSLPLHETNELQSSGALSIGMNPGEVARDTCVKDFGNDSVRPSGDHSPPPLVSEGTWIGALHIAVQRSHSRIVRILLQHGVDCNQKDGEGLTPLIHSIVSNHEDLLSLLIQHGARISETDNHSCNAVHWAVSQRREALLKVLLEHCSGDQTVMERHDLSGRTPLHVAVDIGFEAGVRILMEYGADSTAKLENTVSLGNSRIHEKYSTAR
jgi:hypothetical protein